MNDISGEVHMYDNHSLKLKWKRNFSSYTEDPMKMKIDHSHYTYRKVFNQVEMNEERIYALIDKKKLFFISRKTGQILHRMDQPMEKFGQFDNKYLYTLVHLNSKMLNDDFDESDEEDEYFGQFKILFYNIPPKIPPIQIFANESDTRIIHCWGDGRWGHTTSMKGDKIVGIHCEEEFELYYLVSWNITSGKEIFRVSMMDVYVYPPIENQTYGCTLKGYLVDDYAFYIEFDYDGILKWPYVGFSTHALCKPFFGFDGTFIIDATTGKGKLCRDPRDHYHCVVFRPFEYDLEFHMEIAMIHFVKNLYWGVHTVKEDQALRLCFVELDKYLDYELEHKSVRNLFVKYPDRFNITPYRSQIGFTNGRILIVILKDRSGIYLAKLNFWS